MLAFNVETLEPRAHVPTSKQTPYHTHTPIAPQTAKAAGMVDTDEVPSQVLERALFLLGFAPSRGTPVQLISVRSVTHQLEARLAAEAQEDILASPGSRSAKVGRQIIVVFRCFRGRGGDGVSDRIWFGMDCCFFFCFLLLLRHVSNSLHTHTHAPFPNLPSQVALEYANELARLRASVAHGRVRESPVARSVVAFLRDGTTSLPALGDALREVRSAAGRVADFYATAEAAIRCELASDAVKSWPAETVGGP